MIGKTISHYKILEKLGEGGMGVVYKAQDTKLDRFVALKFLPQNLSQSEEEKQRFIHEAKAASALDHNNICTIHEIAEAEDGQLFIAMALYEGQTLDTKIEDGPLKLDEAIDIAVQISEGMANAHNKEIVHRDLKPANVMLTEAGVVKILDFGLAKLRGQTKLTKEGTTLGTVGYMSPEQTQGAEVDQRTDIFSLGVSIYEMVTGQQPFQGDYEQAVMYSILHKDPEPITGLRTGVPMELERIVTKAMAKSADERYQQVQEMGVDLRQVQKNALEPPSSPRQISQPEARRKQLRTRIPIFAIVVLLLLGASYLYFSFLAQDKTDSTLLERKMLVVLPFENLGATEDDYFADGLTEEITSRLAVVYGLGVISRTSAVQYKQTQKTIGQIGDELGVDYVLEGTVRWAREAEGIDRVRVTLQLIQVSDDIHLWSEQYDSVMDDLFNVQSEIAERVVKQLDIKLLEPERKALRAQPTRNFDAYELYLLAQKHWRNSSDRNEAERAIELFEQAIDLDPNFAMAYVRLSLYHSRMYLLGMDLSEERLEKSKRTADMALQIHPDLPEAYNALARYYYRGFRDYDRALEMFKLVQKARPNTSTQIIGGIYRRQGKWEESLSAHKENFKLNPRSVDNAVQIALSYTLMHKYDEADKWFNRALRIYPESKGIRVNIAMNYIDWKGSTEETRALLKELPILRTNQSWLAIYRLDRQYDQALVLLNSIPQKSRGLQQGYFQKNLAYATFYYLKKDTSLMHIHADSARIFFEKDLEDHAGDANRRAALGRTYAYLGRKQDAIRAGKRAVEIMPVSKDAAWGPSYVLQLAEIYAVVGEYGLAIDQLEYLMSIPSSTSVNWIRLDPWWDVLRDHHTFKNSLLAMLLQNE